MKNRKVTEEISKRIQELNALGHGCSMISRKIKSETGISLSAPSVYYHIKKPYTVAITAKEEFSPKMQTVRQILEMGDVAADARVKFTLSYINGTT